MSKIMFANTTLNSITDAMPPFAMDDPKKLAIGGAIGAGLALKGIMTERAWERAGEAEIAAQQYPDPDQAETVSRMYSRKGRANKLGLLSIGAASAFAGLHLAEPHDDESIYSADRVAIVVEAGRDTRARDVEAEDGSDISRVRAALTGADFLANSMDNNVVVDIVLAGSNPKSAGELASRADIDEIVTATNEYLGEYDNAGDPDIAGAIAVAEVNDPDRIIIITQNSTPETENDLRDNPDAIVVSLGREGTKFTFQGNEVVADYENSFGSIQAETAQTVDELNAILKREVTDDIVTEERRDIKAYKYVSAAFGALPALFGLKKLLEVPKQPNRRRK